MGGEIIIFCENQLINEKVSQDNKKRKNCRAEGTAQYTATEQVAKA